MSDVNELELKATAADAELVCLRDAIYARGTITDAEALELRTMIRANRRLFDAHYGVYKHWSCRFYELLHVFLKTGRLSKFRREAVFNALAEYCQPGLPFPVDEEE